LIELSGLGIDIGFEPLEEPPPTRLPAASIPPWMIRPGVLIAPIAQLKASLRTSDSGANATYPIASGFDRLLAAPGLEVDVHPFKVYGDVELPLWEHFTGNQVAAAVLVRVNIAIMF